MSIPVTSNATVSLIRKSKLVAEDRLRRYLARLDPHELDTLAPEELLDRLVDDGLLTPFQADQLGHGRYQGFVLGDYRIQSRIGRGGMGQVFLAEQMNTGRRVAVKVLRKAADNTPLARERFVREALASAKLSHPNIIQVFDANPESDPPYLVMEYVDGVSLQAAVAQYGPFAAAEAAECGRQIALGLQHASDAGLVHRDIKPANILLDRRGTAKILDLGIVRVVGEALTQLGQSDVILGTVEYLAPEQALSSQVDGRADIYSLGATLYFLLTGRPPFPDGDARTKILQLASERPVPIRQLAPSVPPGLADVVETMLAKQPEDRFQWASEAARALEPFATPTDFPSRFFTRPTSTVANEGSPTAALAPDAVQPLPGVTVATPPPCDPATGTVEIVAAADPTEPITATQLTLRTRVSDDGEEPTDADEGEVSAVDPRLTRVLYALLAAILAWSGYVLFMSP
ncbi:MAG: serine/threonine protein kinase [Gemmataceae bacterium]|nr:serine/threonine protein kinase [Gemmataceae bacterium]